MNEFDKRIKKGWYTDKYFVRTRDILRKAGRKPDVIMQVFAKKRGVFCGGTESARIIKECGSRKLIVKILAEGDVFFFCRCRRW